LIVNPAAISKRRSGFVPAGNVRKDHEVEMALSDLLQATKNAYSTYELIKGISEEQGLEGWVQEKIIKAADYLNTIREYYEGKMAGAQPTNESPDGVNPSTKMVLEKDDEDVADFFVNAAKKLYPHATIRKNGETMQEPDKSTKIDNTVTTSPGLSDSEISELEQQVEELVKRFKNLGGTSYQYADRMTDRDRQAQSVHRELLVLKDKLEKAKK
jgi:hypothetical protein